jgi:hypothetical protein
MTAAGVIGARAGRVAAGTVGLVLGGTLVIADIVATAQTPLDFARVHRQNQLLVAAAWVGMVAAYAIARLAQRRDHNSGDGVGRAGRARLAFTREYRSTALPLAALVLLLPSTFYYLVGLADPAVLVPTPLSIPGRLTRGDIIAVVGLRHLLVPFVIPCFGLARALRADRPIRGIASAFRMHPLNYGLLSIYALWMLVLPMFLGGSKRIVWVASIVALATLVVALPRLGRRIIAERVPLLAVAGPQHVVDPRWLRWLKAAAILVPFVVLAGLFVTLGSRTSSITCASREGRVECTNVETTFMTSSTLTFTLVEGDVIEVEIRSGSKGGKTYRLARRSADRTEPLGDYFSDEDDVRDAAAKLNQAAQTGVAPGRFAFGSRWRGIIGAVILLFGALIAALEQLRRKPRHSVD